MTGLAKVRAMQGTDYTPAPLRTDSIFLPPEIAALSEKLAENTHEIWAAERLAAGWRWGPRRDDGEKLHPCLVPYAQLPESEKRLDRETALGTLRAILTLGWKLVPPET